MTKNPKIVYMGTPDFAVHGLGSLIKNGFNVVAVVTAPDRPAGRGQKTSQSAVAKYASEKQLKLLQPENLKDEAFINSLWKLSPDIAIVVAFRMLPESVWRIPKIGTFNLHASLLPQYRGAAPINHVLINGETETGITTFLIDDKIDTGNILYRKKLNISHSENAGELHNRLMIAGSELLIKTVNMLSEGSVKPLSQDNFISENEVLRSAPKIFPYDCFINWTDKGNTIYNFVRGLSPYPGARTYFKKGDKKILVKILEGQHRELSNAGKPGILKSDHKGKMYVSTGDGDFELIIIQPEGKKVMRVSEYLRGTDPHSISIFTDPQA